MKPIKLTKNHSANHNGCFCRRGRYGISPCKEYINRLYKLGIKPDEVRLPKYTPVLSSNLKQMENNRIYEKIDAAIHHNNEYNIEEEQDRRRALGWRQRISLLHFPPQARAFIYNQRDLPLNHPRFLIPNWVATSCGIDLEDANVGFSDQVVALPIHPLSAIKAEVSYLEFLHWTMVENGDEEDEYKGGEFSDLWHNMMGMVHNQQDIITTKNKLDSPHRQMSLPNPKRNRFAASIPVDMPLMLKSPIPEACVSHSVDSSSIVPDPIVSSDVNELTREFDRIQSPSKVKSQSITPDIDNLMRSIPGRFLGEAILEKVGISGKLKMEVPSPDNTLAGLMEGRTPIVGNPQEWQSKVRCQYPIYILSRRTSRFSPTSTTNGIIHEDYVVTATLDTDRDMSEQLVPIGVLHTNMASMRPTPKKLKKALGSRYSLCDNPPAKLPESFMHCTEEGCGVLQQCIENESGTIVYIDDEKFTIYACPPDYMENDDMTIMNMIEWAKTIRNGGDVSDVLGIFICMYLQHRRKLKKNDLLEMKRQPIPRSVFNTAVNDTLVDIVQEMSDNTEVLSRCFFKRLDGLDINDALRIIWSHINPMRTGLDTNLPGDVLAWKKRVHQIHMEYCEQNDFDPEELKNICDFAVVAHSQEQKDEQSFELGARLFDGGFCIPERFLDCLKFCKFTELYEGLSAIFKFSSMQQQKAIAQISSHVLTFFAYGSKQPVDKRLLGYFQIWFKKWNILSGVAKNGAYIGPGWDRHVFRFAACHLPLSFSGYSEAFLEDLLRLIGEFPGGFMNEVIANLGQIMDRGSDEAKAVVEEVFEEAISIRPQLESVIKRWRSHDSVQEEVELERGARSRKPPESFYTYEASV